MLPSMRWSSPRIISETTALVLVVACGTATPAPSEPREADEPAHVRAEPQPEVSSSSEAPPPPPPPRARVRYDLAANLARAEVFEGDAQVLRLGGAAGAKHTLGGWHSGMREGLLDGVPVALGLGRSRIYFALEEARPVRLTLHGRQLRPGDLRLYVNGEQVARVRLPTEGFGAASVELAAEDVRAGENELLVRTPGTTRLDGYGPRGAALSWLRVGPPGDEGGEVALALADRVVSIPEGARVRWTVAAVDGARLRGELLEGRGTIRVGSSESVARGSIDLPLPAGEPVRLEIEAEEALRLRAPAVVTLDDAERAIPTPKNVVVFLIDTLRADKLSPYDPETRVRTPGLRRFVEGATTFAHAHTQENWTKPSVATLLSSLMPWEHTATQHESVVPDSVDMLPEVLQREGFETAAFIANGYVSDRFGFGQGWDSYRNYIREGRRTPAQYVASDVLAWLDERDEESPFFLYVHTIDPHVPYRPPEEFLEPYADPAYRGQVSFRTNVMLLEHIKMGRVRLNAADRRHLEALYDGEISYHDVHFRAILDGLERRGLDDETLVIITSDHGEELFDHGSVGHGHSVYEELLHIPLFVRLPGASQLRRVDRPVGLVDVMPTILEALGIEAPEELSGESFLPTLRGDAEGAPAGSVSAFMENWRTYTDGRWKLVQRPGNRSRLYDLAADPNEENDLAEARPELVHWLRGELGLRLGATPSQIGGRSARPRRTHAAESTEIDEETAAQLRALGYMGH